MATHHFKINAPAHGRATTVEMDGAPLTGLRGISFTTSVVGATVVTCEFINATVEVETEADAEGIREVTQFGSVNHEYEAVDIPEKRDESAA